MIIFQRFEIASNADRLVINAEMAMPKSLRGDIVVVVNLYKIYIKTNKF